jgi:hypothetical protein
MAAVWRRAWWSKQVSSSTGLGSASGGGGTPWPISGSTTTTSGTTLSTTTTYTTISSDPVGQRPLVVEESADEGLDAVEFKQELVETRRHLRRLVEEFCGSTNGNVTAPDRWLSELNVAWLLHLAELSALDTSSPCKSTS